MKHVINRINPLCIIRKESNFKKSPKIKPVTLKPQPIKKNPPVIPPLAIPIKTPKPVPKMIKVAVKPQSSEKKPTVISIPQQQIPFSAKALPKVPNQPRSSRHSLFARIGKLAKALFAMIAHGFNKFFGYKTNLYES